MPRAAVTYRVLAAGFDGRLVAALARLLPRLLGRLPRAAKADVRAGAGIGAAIAMLQAAAARGEPFQAAVLMADALRPEDMAPLHDILNTSDLMLALVGDLPTGKPLRPRDASRLLRLAAPLRRREARDAIATALARWQDDLGRQDLDKEVVELRGARAALTAELRSNLLALQECEGELGRQNRLFYDALNNMPHGMCMWDADFHLIACNNRYREMFDMPGKPTMPGMHLRDVIKDNIPPENHPQETAEETADAFVKLITENHSSKVFRNFQGGRTVAIATNRMKDGGYVTVYADATKTKNQIAALRQREEELRIQNLRFDVALNNMAHGLCMFDGDGRLIVCNRPYAELYGLPPELTVPGTTLTQILAFGVEKGLFRQGDPQYAVAYRVSLATANEAYSHLHELRNGQIIAVEHRPMEGGGWVTTHQDITEQKRYEDQIRHMARHDGLTGLPNRLLLHERMEEALARVRRGEILAVHCLDLDHFKSVNDTLGHPLGDTLLRQVARRLQDCVRETDTVARLGGDEFAVIQAHIERPEDAEMLGRRLVEALSEPYDLDGHQVMIGTSIGVTLAPHDGSTADDLLKNADMALYRAKTEGRGTYRFFEIEMDAQLQTRRALELDLRRALVNGEFVVYYQPLVNLKSNRITGFEALLRWNRPGHGLVPPVEFIGLSEEIGLIVQIGEWVLREACREATTWPGDIRVAVNLSPAQFRNRNLTQDVIRALAASGLDAHRLELEITESVLLIENDATLATLHQLRSLGVRIAMDDFGTGYSSLSYLRSFPFDKIKIDGSFIRDSSSRADCAAIIRAVAGLGTSLGIPTTAEGVETEEQLQHVFDEGCTEVQGYLFSHPRPAADIAGLLTANIAEASAA